MSFEIDKLKDIDPSIFTNNNSILHDAMSALINDINAKKEQVVKDKLEELGIDINWELEKTRRFKSILIEYHKETGDEVYYYNDGTEEGQRVVTFVLDKEQKLGTNLTMGYSYY